MIVIPLSGNALHDRQEGCIVEGGIRLPRSPAVHYLQHFVLSILLVNEVQNVKHAELQKDRKTPEYLS